MTDSDSNAGEEEQIHRLLVVDDNEQNRDMLSRRLARRGYRVAVAEDGERALEAIDEAGRGPTPFDLILLDIMMPGIDGLEVLRRLRIEHRSDELPVIMATARDDSDDVVEALELGANDYVTKPIDFPVVLARVKKELRSLDGARAARRNTEEAPAPPASSGDGKPVGAGAAPAAQTTAQAGMVIDGRYRLEEKIGRGNFGVVYRGRHADLGRDVAVKILQSQFAEGSEALARFRVEGQSAVRVQHENAVTVYDFGVTDEGLAYLVMELLDGEPLSTELERHSRLHPHRVRAILEPVCAVLTEAHGQGLVHRDIKPENVFLQQRRGDEVIKVLDFGIAKLVGEHVARENLTAEGFVLGTPAYMAPERLRNRPYDGRSDVYSLGIMLYQMLAGRLPFRPKKGDPMALLMMHVEKDPPKLGDAMPEYRGALEDLVDQCLSKEARERPTARELGQRLGEIAATIGPDEAASTHVLPGVEGPVDDDAPTQRLDSSKVMQAPEPSSEPQPESGGLLRRWLGRRKKGDRS